MLVVNKVSFSEFLPKSQNFAAMKAVLNHKSINKVKSRIFPVFYQCLGL